MASRRKTVLTQRQLRQIAAGSVLVGLTVTILSALYRTDTERVLTLTNDRYLDGSWLGWPIPFLYQTDIVNPNATDVDQTVDGVLFGLNWLFWSMLFVSVALAVIVIRLFYAYSRR